MLIRELTSLEDIAGARDLFRRVWAAPERESVPAEVLRAMTAHGSLLLGAFDGSGLAGAVLGDWGRDDDGHAWMYSSKLGVGVPYRGTGLAERLKREQAAWAAARGVEELRWTFDPMRARNAAFNLAKLGAVGIAFHENLYGDRRDAFNAGERTDRMLVSWRPGAAAREPGAVLRLVDVPPDHAAYMARPDRERAAERDRVRDELRAAFGDGFRATGFRRPGTYVMTR